MLPLVSGHESHHSETHLRREEDFAPRSVSACMAVLRTDAIPIRNMGGWPSAEAGVSCMDSPEPATPRRALERARLSEWADEAACEHPHRPFANTELLGRAGWGLCLFHSSAGPMSACWQPQFSQKNLSCGLALTTQAQESTQMVIPQYEEKTYLLEMI